MFYTSNILFLVHDYYIFILNHQPKLRYQFHYIQKKYFLEIKNKENQPLTIHLKILNKENKAFYYSITKERNNFILLNDFDTLLFSNKHHDVYQILHKEFIQQKYSLFDPDMYKQNLFSQDVNDTFLYNNWYYFGQYNKFQYWKYILYKNKSFFHNILKKINYTIDFDHNKKYTLVFIDDRFDQIFEYILIMFYYGVNANWNLHIFSCEACIPLFQNICSQFKIKAKYHVIEKFQSVHEYSSLLKDISFWNHFKEEYVLLFQYDSCCFRKLTDNFLNMDYVGAQWPDHIQQIKGIYNGNGGTSFRKVSTMKYICQKYYYKLFDEKLPEDIYFSKYLHQEKILMNNPTLCNEFSMENVKCIESIFGHAIYECIPLEEIEEFLIKR